jgi:murein L,D-transpeptidase YcbB/YkuD
MTSFRYRHALSLLCAACLLIPVPSHARTLFDMLFERRDRVEEPDDTIPPPRPRARTERPRQTDPQGTGAIAAPRKSARAPVKPAVQASRIYAYKAAPLVALKASRLAAQSNEVAGPPPVFGGNSFAHAVRQSGELELRVEKIVHDGLIAHYKAKPAFIWLTDGEPNGKAEAVQAALAKAGAMGLNAADYALPVSVAGELTDPVSALRYELTLSALALRYGHDALNGRIIPNRLSDFHDFEPKPFDGGALLAKLAIADEPAAVLAAQHPANEQFQILSAELERLRGEGDSNPLPTVAPGTIVKPGQTNPEFPKILQLVAKTLGGAMNEEQRVLLYDYRDSETYDPALVALVKDAQKAKGLKADGVIGPASIAAMAGQTHGDRVRAVELALERLRWLPRDFGSRHVFINQPAFWASYRTGGREELGMRVVVGTKENQTSFFHDKIEYVEFNPYWGVPKSILVNEMLPKLQRDPSYLDRIGYEVYTANGTQVSSSSVDWWNGGANQVFVRQPPSEKNALGELKIMFPNKHDIYMHDTPERKLFERDVRAFSHGCIRLHKPRDMAAAVLGTDMDTIEARLALGHNSLKLDAPIPVYVSYFTAWPDDSGTVQYYGDVYGRDAQLAKAIAATEAVRRGAEPNEG